MIRIGQGFDLHQIGVEGKALILGGVPIPHPYGFKAHSDGDILIHALCDALLGALAKGDIGHYFNDQDPQWKNKPSLETFLPPINKLVEQEGYHIQNIDATIIMEAPKLAPYISSIREKISKALGLSVSQFSLKATRTEKCFLTAPQEAAIAQVTLLLVKEDLFN